MYCVNPENRHVPQAEETLVAVDSTETALEDEEKETPPEEAKKDVWKDIFGVSEGTPVALCQDELEGGKMTSVLVNKTNYRISKGKGGDN